MKDLHIPRTPFTPEISFNAQTAVLQLIGESYPENCWDFYQPALDWLHLFLFKSNLSVTFNCKLSYFNTSSTKIILEMFELLEKYNSRSGNVDVNWYYPKDDEDILEDGQGFASDIHIPFHFIPVSSHELVNM